MIKFFIFIRASIMLWYATKQADKAYRGEYKIGKNMDKSNRYMVPNRRYYVMPNENNDLICMNRSEFHKLRTKGQMSPEAKVKHLMKESFYFTPQANGRKPISKELKAHKKKVYIKFCIANYYRRKAEKKSQNQYVRDMKRRLYASKNAPLRHY